MDSFVGVDWGWEEPVIIMPKITCYVCQRAVPFEERVALWEMYFCSELCAQFVDQAFSKGIHITKIAEPSERGWPMMVRCPDCGVTEITHNPYATKPFDGDIHLVTTECTKHFKFTPTTLKDFLEPL